MKKIVLQLAGAALAIFLGVWIAGCGTPQEKYRTLSFFFDGVPNPDAPKVARRVTAAGSTVTLAIVSRHKPYVDNNCESCHRSATGQMMDFSEAWKRCTSCHKDATNKYARMHGPVARAACNFCHTGHESVEPKLLRAAPIKVCTQCHDQQLLGPKPSQHNDGVTSCITCHSGHGGPEANFLKPNWQTEWPKSAATAPATAPAASRPSELAPAPAADTRQGGGS